MAQISHIFDRLVPVQVGRVKFAPLKTAWLYAMLVPSVIWGFDSLSLRTACGTAVLTLLTVCLGHSVGLHRGIIHQGYRCSRLVRNILAYLFVQSGLGGPLSWIRLHHVRDYWQNTSDCPRYFGYSHGVARDYVWNLHSTFIPNDWSRYALDPDQENDRWLIWLERTWTLHPLGLALLLWWLFGFDVAVVCVCVRVTVTILGHWFVGFAAHKHGKVRYELHGSPEIGRNLVLLGILSFGEGFHNNHHAHPASARMGEAWYELDLGWWCVRCLEWLGIFQGVQSLTRDPTLKANAERIAH